MPNKKNDNNENTWTRFLSTRLSKIKKIKKQTDMPEEVINIIKDNLESIIPKENIIYELKTISNINYTRYILKIKCSQDHYFVIDNHIQYDRDGKLRKINEYEIYHQYKSFRGYTFEIALNKINASEISKIFTEIYNNFDSYLNKSINAVKRNVKQQEKNEKLIEQINTILKTKFPYHEYNESNLLFMTDDELLVTVSKEKNKKIIENINNLEEIENLKICIPAFTSIMELHQGVDRIEFEIKKRDI